MGYFTNYRLVWMTESKPISAFTGIATQNTLDADIEKYFAEHLNDMVYFEREGSEARLGEVKWYDHEKDMLALSKSFPLVTFILSGEGEESGDLWRKRFINGHCDYSHVVITYSDWSAQRKGR